MKTEMGVFGEPHELRPRTPTAIASATVSYGRNEAENDEPSTVVIKIEYDDEVCFSAGDLDIEREQPRQVCLTNTAMASVQKCDIFIKKEDEICKIIKEELCIGPTVLQKRTMPAETHYPDPRLDASCDDDATPRSLHTITLESAPRVKIEEHHYEDNVELNVSKCNFAFNVNTSDNVDENTVRKQNCTSVATRENVLCAFCGSVLTECKCRPGMAIVKLVTLTDEKVYECEHCAYVTDKKTHLRKHVRLHVAKKGQNHKQHEYSESLGNSSKMHIHRHTAEQLYKCEDTASDQGNINRHSSKKRYKYKECGYTSSNQRCLKSYAKVHTDEKPYKCKKCQYRTACSTALKVHMNTHRGKKPYSWFSIQLLAHEGGQHTGVLTAHDLPCGGFLGDPLCTGSHWNANSGWFHSVIQTKSSLERGR
ncbi:Zinc finger protein 852 [Eumeta japonica]|uniref:Zinc finger protein 852 n=1 Tax=Eumeta variegata TaxID=151549 RepID=A0A4C1WIT9_EUMVA|nr:Zinc finger protein 852 [Eumeta japonica]